MNFNTLKDNIIPMEDFTLNWRITDENYTVLPQIHLEQLLPLDEEGSNSIDDFINDNELHDDFPFKTDFFTKNEDIAIEEGQEKKIERWFGTLGLNIEDDVYLSWDPETALKTKLKYVIKYWKSLYHRDSDDLTVFSADLNWALLFFHEGRIYFGKK
tara:strand:+ start:2593 stop:3063 length:471 start_codon:yes stop_codon:yes gene_type:complete